MRTWLGWSNRPPAERHPSPGEIKGMSEQHFEETGRPVNGDGRPVRADRQDEHRTEQPQKQAVPNGRKRLLIGAGVAVVAIAALLWWLHARKFEDTDDAQIDGYISAIASRVAGTVVRVAVEDNQPVKPGDVLVELDAT